jgi:hypothetical protein
MPTPPTFPLRVSHTKRYLTDAHGRPFLVVGDTAWSLVVQLTPDEAKLYLDDRQRRGFNAILVNLLEHKFCSQAPRTRAGVAPFEKPGDFASPNPAYFDFAEQVVREAGARGIVVFLCPAYLGYDGGDEGWFREIRAGGRKALYDYGRFIGERFRDHHNIIWTIGGDFTPPEDDLWTVDAVAEGIRLGGSRQIMTGHGRPGHSAVDAFPKRDWLTVNATYSYDAALYRPLQADYRRRPAWPFVLLESTYENEHDARPEQIRRQAYWAILCGACGQFLGNNPIWHFDGPGLFPAPVTWQKALDGTGSRDMARLRSAFAERAWHRLIPAATVAQIDGKDADEVTVAITPNGTLGMAYIASAGTDKRTATIPIGACTRARSAQWFNPASGQYVSCPATDLSRPTATFIMPGDNGTGTNDWLLVWEVDASRGSANDHLTPTARADIPASVG